MQKSSKFLISDLISEQASIYATSGIPVPIVHSIQANATGLMAGLRSHESASNFLSTQTMDMRNSASPAHLNDLLYSQINEFFLKTKQPVPYSIEQSMHMNEFGQHTHDQQVGMHVAGSAFCGCISCQALRFFNLVNQQDIAKQQQHQHQQQQLHRPMHSQEINVINEFSHSKHSPQFQNTKRYSHPNQQHQHPQWEENSKIVPANVTCKREELQTNVNDSKSYSKNGNKVLKGTYIYIQGYKVDWAYRSE